jgi:hypothetical protein
MVIGSGPGSVTERASVFASLSELETEPVFARLILIMIATTINNMAAIPLNRYFFIFFISKN